LNKEILCLITQVVPIVAERPNLPCPVISSRFISAVIAEKSIVDIVVMVGVLPAGLLKQVESAEFIRDDSSRCLLTLSNADESTFNRPTRFMTR
jgi:hypothetical protein